jgi:NAD-dependent deacetylase
LWRTHRVEQLASSEGFERDPVLVWTWYNERKAAHSKATPNPGHDALAQLEHVFGDFTLATQNVDSLHLRAGSLNVLELHGNLREARCTHCNVRRPFEEAGLPLDEIEHSCGGRFRPDIVWFGEPLPEAVWSAAEAAAARADVILVVGTSAVVYPAAALATQYNRRAFIAEINPQSTPISDRLDCVLRGTAAELLPRIVSSLENARAT